MMVPDGLVWASIPVLAGCLLWAGRGFVIDTVNQRGPKGEDGKQGEQGNPGPGMSVRSYKELSEMLVTQLNGRYMMADEARQRFDLMAEKIDDLKDSLHSIAEGRYQKSLPPAT